MPSLRTYLACLILLSPLLSTARAEVQECSVLNVGTSPDRPSTMTDVVKNGKVAPAYVQDSRHLRVVDHQEGLFYLYILNFNKAITVGLPWINPDLRQLGSHAEPSV